MLTKSDYLAGRHCVKKLWLRKFRGSLAAPPSPGDLNRRSNGQQLGRLARTLFSEGTLVTSPNSDTDSVVQETLFAIQSGANTIFEAGIEHEGMFVRCDVLRKNGDEWEIVEFKSSTRVKDEHLDDLAFQVRVARLAGFQVTRATLGRVDSTQVREDGPLNPDQIFALEDVTKEVERLQVEVADWTGLFLRVVDSEIAPDVSTNTHCSSPSKCEFYLHCHVDRPENDVVKLPGIKATKVTEFRQAGVSTIAQIPDGEKLSPIQKRIRDVVRFTTPFVGDDLAAALSQVRFPAHFIDFEAAMPVLPLYKGMRPYQAFPFQWSDHHLTGPDAEPVHQGFIHAEQTDPREEFARTLYDSIKAAQTVVFYSAYELTTVRALAQADIPYGEGLAKILEERGLDLLKIVKDHVYFSEFDGSFSIKKVLPALVPDTSYAGLTIKDGDAAATEYLRMISPETGPDEAQSVRKALEAYCTQDTLAMVKLYLSLSRLSVKPS